MPYRTPIPSPCLTLLVLAVVAGCHDGPTLYTTTGKVTYQGQPPAGATVVFTPTSGEDALKKTASAMVQPDGSFSLQTYPHGDGAFPGEYQVSVTWLPENAREIENAKNKLPAKYANPATSGLTATVKEEATELPPIELNP